MKKPNILLLHGDQHRWDCLGCYGNPDVKTPHIDCLAEEGTRYTNHFTVYPVCTPSRYSLFSGQYVHQHSAWTNQSTLPAGTATFPRLLRQAGWHTAAVGKMHFTPTYLDVGFERMTLSEQNGEGRFEDDYHTWLMEQGRIDAIDLTDQVDAHRRRAGRRYYDHFGAFESDLPQELHSTSWITSQALKEIGSWDPQGGNLLMAGYIKPHHPFDPPAPYSTMYDPAALQLLPGYTPEVPAGDFANHHGFFDHRTLTEERLRHIMAMYYGTITQIDTHIGEILALLKEKGMYDDPMIIYTSDHGEYLGCHHMLLKGNYLYDPLARIPLIIKYPKGMESVGRDDRLSENIDLCAAILSVCGIRPADTMCGLDLRSEQRRSSVFSEGQYGTDACPRLGYMLRSRQYKLLVNGSMEDAMFFDLEKDPLELRNEISNPAYREEIRQLQRDLVDRVLFSGGGKNHLDVQAPQLREPASLAERSRALQAYIHDRIGQAEGWMD